MPQNMFFASASGAARTRGNQHIGPPDIPRYRGLVTVLCDEYDDHDNEGLSDSSGSEEDDDAWYDQSDSDSSSAEPHEDDRDDTMRLAEINIADPNASAPASYREPFAAPIADPAAKAPKVDEVSNDVIAVRTARVDSMSSELPTSPSSVSPSSSMESTSTAPTSIVVPSQKSTKHKKRRSRARLQAGAKRCLLQSAMSPHEIITDGDEPAEFIKARVPDGISL